MCANLAVVDIFYNKRIESTENLQIGEKCKGGYCLDLGESFQMRTYLFATFCFDTAEKEPCKVCLLFVYLLLHTRGVKYERGEGVTQDRATAVELYQQAHRAGHAGATYNLGVIWPSISNALTGVRAKEISKSRFPVFPNFLGLVLGCIEAKFCK